MRWRASRKAVLAFVAALAVVGAAVLTVPIGDRFAVTRDVRVDWPIVPEGVTLASDGGYVIVGLGRAMRLDGDGHVVWRHLFLRESPGRRGSRPPSLSYASGVDLPGGATLLCGSGEAGSADPEGPPAIAGVLARLDSGGAVVERRLLYPRAGTGFRLSYLHRCAAWGGGIALVGEANRFVGGSPAHRESFYWIVALDANGQLRWERLVPIATLSLNRPEAVVLPGGDLVLAKAGNGGPDSATDVLRIDTGGTVRVHRTIPRRAILVQPVGGRADIALLAQGRQHAALYELGDGSEVAREESLSLGGFSASHAYRGPDGELVMIGYARRGLARYTALAEVSARGLRESLVLPVEAAPWVEAIPTGRPEEFAVVGEAAGLRAHQGIALAYVRPAHARAFDTVAEYGAVAFDQARVVLSDPLRFIAAGIASLSGTGAPIADSR